VTDLLSGVELIPMMVGMFAVSEILRYMVDMNPQGRILKDKLGSVFTGMWTLTKNTAGACCAAARSAPRSASSRRRRRHGGLDVVCDEQALLQEPEKFGTGTSRHHRSGRGRTTAPWPAPGSRRWCSAFPATASPPSPSACSTSRG
jgi:hypothetical protein